MDVIMFNNKIILFLTVSLLLQLPVFASESTIKVGLLIDYSGKTRDVARSYLRGLKDYFNYYNSNNPKKKIEVVIKDTKYNPDLALKHYKDLESRGVKVMHAWGTGSCLKIKDHAAKDKVVVFTGSYDAALSTPSKSPYTFFMGASYTDQAIIALKYIKENSPKAKIAIIYNTTSFGKSPFFNKRFENAVKKLKLNLAAHEIVELSANDATEQMKSLKKQGIEYAIIQDATKATVSILSSAHKVGLKTKLIGLNWAFNENIMGLVHRASEGYLGIPLFPQGDQTDIEGIRTIRNYLQKTKGEVRRIPSKYIAAWATAMVIARGIEKNKDKSDYLKSFEGINNFSTQGLTSPVTFNNKSHSALKSTRIYTVRNKNIIPVNSKVYTID